MASALTLLSHNLRSWFGARGFIMVVAAALVPLLLTGAWVATHQRDVAATEITWEPQQPLAGQPITFKATIENKGRFSTGAFNASISVGTVTAQGTLLVETTNQTRIEGLEGGETRQIELRWAQPRSGIFVVLADSDTGAANDPDDDEIPEIEEFNNQKPSAIEIHAEPQNESQAPARPGNLTGPSGSSRRADVSVTPVSWTPAEIDARDNATFSVTVRNEGPDSVTANVTLRAGQVFGNFMYAQPAQTVERNVSLASGASEELSFLWTEVPPGVYWAEAFVNVTDAVDSDDSDNYAATPFVVHLRVPSDFKFPDPPEKLTIKLFYVQILENLHIRILLPFIGLFYAAGVLSDEKERGNLTYILTRPVSRGMIPITKFLASFVVAAVAVLIGILVTFFLLLGTPQGNVGFLTTPLLLSLVALFVYGSFFILMGVLVERPYLVGIGWVLGWETLAGNLVPWVKNLTLSHYLIEAIKGWPVDQGIKWLPEGDARSDLINILVAAVFFLVAAAFVMRSREFDV